MSKKYLIMGGIAVVFGGLSIVAADFWLKSNVQTIVETVEVEADSNKPRIEFGTIVVAAEPMRYGAVIDAGMVTEIPWPKDRMPAGAFQTVDVLLSDGERSALAAIEQNEPILVGKVTDAGDRATLSRRIEEGMRAVTIRVDDISGVGGFIVPGDRVDIALTRTFEIEGRNDTTEDYAPIEISPAGDRTYTGDPDSFVASTIVLRSVKVLSIDQIADERQSDPVVVRAVTVEVDELGAKALSAAKQAGTLSLHLRGAGDIADEFPVPPQGLDASPTASYTRDAGVTGFAKITVHRKTESETYDVRDEEAGR